MPKGKDIKINLVLDDKQISAKIVNADKLVHTLRKSATRTSDSIAKWAVLTTGFNQALQIVGKGMRMFDQILTPFAEFDAGLRNVNSIISVTETQIMGMGDEILNIQKELGITNTDLTEGLYQAVSAGVAAGDAIEFLNISARTAKAGLTSTAVSVDGLTTVLNAFHLEADQTEKVADIMFQTVKLGKTTFEELASNLSTVTSIAAASNIPFEQLAGAVATLTKQGVPTSQAMTQIRASIISLNDILPDGWAKTMSYQEAVALLNEKAGGSPKILKEMMGRVEGVNAVLSLTGKNAITAAEDLEAMNNSLGAMDDAFAEQTKSMQFSIDVLKEVINVFIIKAVGLIAPALIDAFKTASGVMDDITGLFESSSQRAMDSLKDQQKVVSDLEKDLVPLIDEYDTLAEKTELSADEQARMKILITDIGNKLPTVITEFDKYGNAIAISTEKAKDWIKLQQAMLKVKNKEAIEEYTESIEDLKVKQGSYQEDLKRFNAEGELVKLATETFKVGAEWRSTTKEVKLGGDEITKLQADLGNVNEELLGTEEILKRLKGEDFVIPEIGGTGVTPPPTITTKTIITEIKGQSEFITAFENRINALKEYEDALISMDDVSKELWDIEESRQKEISDSLREFTDEENLRLEEITFNEQLAFSSKEQLLNMEMDLEQQRADLISKLSKRIEKDKRDLLNKEKKIVEQRIDNINLEIEARERLVAQSVSAGFNMYNSNVALGKQMANLTRDTIRRLAAEAVANYIASTFASAGIFALILAPVAGFAAAALFESLIPSFEAGGKIKGKRHLQGGEIIEAEEGEFIVNRKATIKNFNLLEQINKDTFAGGGIVMRPAPGIDEQDIIFGDDGIVINRQAITNGIEQLESISAGRSVIVNAGGQNNGEVVKAIHQLGDRIKELEIIAKILPEDFEERYNEYLNQDIHSG